MPPRKSKPSNEWIQTYSGAKFFPLKPRAEDVRISDIAAALSKICRFTGHTIRFYSVAEHSVRVSRLAERLFVEDLRAKGASGPSPVTQNQIARWGLMHDGSEAYLADIAAPVKRSAPFLNYRVAEKRLQDEISKACGLPLEMPPEVAKADLIMLATEARALLPGGPHPEFTIPAMPDPEMSAEPMGWDPAYAERQFIDRFAALAKVGG